MSKYYITRNMTGFATGVIEARREPRISKKSAIRLSLIGIIVILLIATGYFDFIVKGVFDWLELGILL